MVTLLITRKNVSSSVDKSSIESFIALYCNPDPTVATEKILENSVERNFHTLLRAM